MFKKKTKNLPVKTEVWVMQNLEFAARSRKVEEDTVVDSNKNRG